MLCWHPCLEHSWRDLFCLKAIRHTGAGLAHSHLLWPMYSSVFDPNLRFNYCWMDKMTSKICINTFPSLWIKKKTHMDFHQKCGFGDKGLNLKQSWTTEEWWWRRLTLFFFGFQVLFFFMAFPASLTQYWDEWHLPPTPLLS